VRCRRSGSSCSQRRAISGTWRASRRPSRMPCPSLRVRPRVVPDRATCAPPPLPVSS
jgi:hypothetical protein